MKVMISIAAGLGLASAAYAAQKLGEYQPERPPEVTYAKVCGYCHGKNVGPIILGRKLDTAVRPASFGYIDDYRAFNCFPGTVYTIESVEFYVQRTFLTCHPFK